MDCNSKLIAYAINCTLTVLVVCSCRLNKFHHSIKVGDEIATDNLKKAIQRQQNSLVNDTIFIENGVYYLENGVLNEELKKNLIIIGLGEVTFNLNTNFITTNAPIVYNSRLVNSLSRGHKKIKVKGMNLPKINKSSNYIGALISDGIVEEGWKYKEGELLDIIKWDNENISLKNGVLLNYDPEEKPNLRIFDSKKVVLKNITFNVGYNGEYDYSNILRIDGCSLELENIKVKNCDEMNESVFASFIYDKDVQVNNFQIEGFKYGLGLDYSKDVFIDSIYSENTIHPIIPATFTQNVKIENVRGYNTCIDAHLAFNVSYDDVDIDTGSDYFNCRSFGVKITNSKFQANPEFAYPSLGLGVSGLIPAYEFLYDEYDVILQNVKWVHPISDYNGFHVHKCKYFILDSVETHKISTGNFIKKLIVKNSRIGNLTCYDSNFEVYNTIFDSKYQMTKIVKEPISCSFSGNAIIKECHFQNYDEYLIGYLSSPQTKIQFEGCDFGEITKMVKTFEFPNEDYKIDFTKCKFNNKIVIPKQLSKSAADINSQIK